MTETESILTLIDTLVEAGYPQEAMASAVVVGQESIDLAIIEPITGVLLALIEVIDTATIPETLTQKLQALHAGYPYPITTLVITSKGKKQTTTVIYPDQRRTEQVQAFPKYEVLKARSLGGLLQTQRAEQRNALDMLTLISRLFVGILSVLFLLDYLQIRQISFEQLTLAALIVGVGLLPFASKLRVLGFEFERVQKAQEQDKER